MLKWETIEHDPKGLILSAGRMHRAKVPGGWLVMFAASGSNEPSMTSPKSTPIIVTRQALD